jgi:hypothetical protein
MIMHFKCDLCNHEWDKTLTLPGDSVKMTLHQTYLQDKENPALLSYKWDDLICTCGEANRIAADVVPAQ